MLWWSIFRASSSGLRLTMETYVWAWECFQKGFTEDIPTLNMDGTVPGAGTPDWTKWEKWDGHWHCPCSASWVHRPCDQLPDTATTMASHLGGLYPLKTWAKTSHSLSYFYQTMRRNTDEDLDLCQWPFPRIFYLLCVNQISNTFFLLFHPTLIYIYIFWVQTEYRSVTN